MDEYSEYGNILNSLENKIFKNTPTSKDFQDSRKIFHHIDRVLDLWKKGDTNPVHLTLGLTNYCQHKCPWCYINYAQAGANYKQSGIKAAGPKAINADDPDGEEYYQCTWRSGEEAEGGAITNQSHCSVGLRCSPPQ